MIFPCVPIFGLAKNNTTTTVKIAGINRKYGLYFPQRLFVLSEIVPIIGSLIASHTEATTVITPTAPAGNPNVSVRKIIRYAPTKEPII